MADFQAASAPEPSTQVDTDAAASTPQYNSTALADGMSTTESLEITAFSTSTSSSTCIDEEVSATTIVGVESKLVDAIGGLEVEEVRMSAAEDSQTATVGTVLDALQTTTVIDDEDGALSTTPSADKDIDSTASEANVDGELASAKIETEPASAQVYEVMDLLKELKRVSGLTEQGMIPEIEEILRRSCEEQDSPIVQDWYTPLLSVEDRLRIQPAIWLTGQILGSERSLQFFDALLFGPRIYTWGEDDQVRKTFHRTNMRNVPLTSVQRNRVLDVVRKTVYVSRVEFNEPDASAPYKASAWPNGLIEISKRHLDELQPMDSLDTPKYELVRQWVWLAYILTHELAHRVHQDNLREQPLHTVYAVMSTGESFGTCDEPTFESDAFAEVGFALDKFLVGGALYNGVEEPLLRELPNPGWLEGVKKDATHVPYPQTPVQSDEIVTMIPLNWLMMHFDPKFWSEEMPRSNGRALQVVREWVYPYWYADGQEDPHEGSSEGSQRDSMEQSGQESHDASDSEGISSDSVDTWESYEGSEVAAVSNEGW
ncbi:unnamed protein product [Zymoseptoria tritici ST99CH_3D7]|uniref:Uncharacterized protein n=2 Tax=Zymoseptoria tritici TaxID=1047171 RepID=A0A1X7RH16_ZYMT9|nr:unnamed protein product [Zymoseptoria tritici ST99CH_3D7]SMR43060.1 unnamed protein product [Zymoseptoria tritici ST99CH_1E4]